MSEKRAADDALYQALAKDAVRDLQDLIGMRDEGLNGTGFENEVSTNKVHGGKSSIGDFGIAKVDDTGAAAGSEGWLLGAGSAAGGCHNRDGRRRGGCGLAMEEERDSGRRA